MYRSNTHEYEESDALLNDSLSEAEMDESAAGDDELRLARIGDYEQESLRQSDTLMACLGATNAGLLRIGYGYEQVIIQAIEAKETNLLDSPALQKLVSTHLGVTRQVDRYANLEIRLRESGQQAEVRGTQRRLAALQHPAGPTLRKNRN